MATASKGTGKGIRVYRASDAPDLHESGATKNDFGPNTELMETAAKLASSDCSINKLMLHQSSRRRRLVDRLPLLQAELPPVSTRP